MDEKRRVTRATGVLGLATLLSRIFGYLRDMTVAAFLGAGMASDAFFVAFRIPNLLRRLFAEGSLTIAFVPVFLEQLRNRGREEAFAMARSALRLLSVILVGVTLLGIVFSPEIVYVVGFGFADVPEKFALTVTLTRIMFSYVFFVCLVALAMGILNALGHFAAPALSPVLLNIAMMASLWGAAMFTDDMTLRSVGLAWGVIAGGVLQLVLQGPFLVKQGLFFWRKATLYHPALKKVGLLMLPAVFGAAVHQVNIIIGTLLATLLPEGSVSYLYYADRLVEFPLGVFGVSAAMAVLPSISRQAAAGDIDAVKDTFGFSMRMIFFLSLPSMVGLIVLREPIVALLFERGGFDAQATRLTADALLYYAVGLWAFSAVRIVVSTFYALSDTRTPVVMAVIAICVNTALSVILMGPLVHGGLALATSIASMTNLVLLTRALAVRLGHIGLMTILRSVAKTAVSSVLMGLVVWGTARLLIPADAHAFVLLAGIIVCITMGVVCFAVFSYILKSREFNALFKRRSRVRDTMAEK
ncbi:MAG: murein biosynthesis integral membrane protein MurJ [Thermodesulfobacteriota bacterium]